MPAPHRALLRVAGTRTVQVALRDAYTPSVDDLLVAPTVAGVCGTDLQILRGERDDASPILGHEGVAEVVAPGASGLQPGQRVVINPTDAANPSFLLGHTVDGMWQQRMVVPAAAVAHGLVVPLDDDVPEVLSTLVEPLAAVLYSRELLEHRAPVRSLAIIGRGIVGSLHAVRAGLVGTRAVIVHTGDDARHEGTFDAVVVCTTRPRALAAVSMALGIVRDGGTIDLFGGITDGDRVAELAGVELNAARRANTGGVGRNVTAATTVSGKAVHLVGHRGVSREHLRAAMRELAAHPRAYGALVTHVASMTAAARLLNRVATGGPRVADDGQPWIKLAVDLRLEGDVLGPGPWTAHHR